jgi:hypothetical protein
MSRRLAPIDHILKERCARSMLLQANVQHFCWQQLNSSGCHSVESYHTTTPIRSEGAKAPLRTLP